jgi:hypothetical protein
MEQQRALKSPAEMRKLKLKRRQALLNIRSNRESEYREITDYLIPRLGRFNWQGERDRSATKYSRYKQILDSAGGHAHRICSAGLMAGMSSPARPWFRLTLSDKDLADYDPVKLWLKDTGDVLRDIFSRSNTYRALHSMYDELSAFGTFADIIEDDYEDFMRHHPLTAGEYSLNVDDRGVVNTLYRDLELSVEQMVDKFGFDNCSTTVQNHYNQSNYDVLIPVMHAIEPRKERNLRKADGRNKAFCSIYLEAGASNDLGLLRDAGYDRFPALAPRWVVTSGDVYGWSPAMEAIGDIKQLQHEQLRKSQGIDYMTEPPLQAPASSVGSIDKLPGGISYVDMPGGQGGVRTMFETKLDLSHLLLDIQDVRQRIDRAFYADLFMMLANDDRSGITAREVAERHEEKLLMLGPVLERLHDEALSPLVDRTFERAARIPGVLPPPPQELQGMELNIEFISTLAQAQRAVGVASVDRLLGVIGSVAQLKPEVVDKLDADQLVDRYADMLGVDPSLIVADEKVALVRQDRAKQQQAAQNAAMAPVLAGTAKDLASADTSGKNALTDAINMFQGYTGAAA